VEPVVVVFGSSRILPGEPEWEEGVLLGRLLARSGAAVATGGYAGMMEAVSSGASAEGGRVIGVTAPRVFPHRHGANPHIGEEHTAGTISERIHRLVDLADATITMPGSIGTLAEFLVAWNDAFVRPMSGHVPKPLVAVGPTWRRLVEFLTEGFDADPGFVTCVDSFDEAARRVATALGLPAPSLP
jgi:uncharacterized protein (TIGR00730 family)